MIRVSRVLHGTRSEGPGVRSAIWVQGCSVRCPGCINPHLFSSAGGMELDPDEVAADAARAGCEGITLLGGEPFDQPTASAALARRARHLGLGVITFTGRTFEDLTAAGTVETMALLSATDLLVDGPYIASMPETERSLVGSTNQRFIHLTDRYRTFDARIAPNRIDVTVSNDGTVRLAGFATAEQLQQLTDGSRMTRAHHRAVNCEDHNGRGPRR